MSDIFISYAHENRDRAAALAHALESKGWSVWWDRAILGGQHYIQVIQEALSQARCLVVIWSKISVKKDWVIEEATEGKERAILVPVLLDDSTPPLGFRLVQAVKLDGWFQDPRDRGFEQLCASISALVPPPAPTAREQPGTKSPPPAEGKLQIHFIDLGGAQAALVISPGGQVAAFDAGRDTRSRDCTRLQSYYDRLNIRQLDFLFVSHYHSDHIGCIASVLKRSPAGLVVDRGNDYASREFKDYQQQTSTVIHRSQARLGDRWFLDGNKPAPVYLEVFAVNANGKPTTNENDLSLGIRLAYGDFRAWFGGDITGFETGTYIDVESAVAPAVGRLDVYNVHQHCSKYSSNENWLAATKPTVAIINVGDNNAFGHPSQDCLDRLHKAGVRTYWTETGAGAPPQSPQDVVAGDMVVEVDLAAGQFTVKHGTATDKYPICGGNSPSPDRTSLSAANPGAKPHTQSAAQLVQPTN